MTMALPKSVCGVRFSIVATVGGLTIFLVMASILLISFPLLISHPINSSSQGYLRRSFVNQPQLFLRRRHGRDPFLNGNDDTVIREPSSPSVEDLHTESGTELSSDSKRVDTTDVSVSQDSAKEGEIVKNASHGLMKGSVHVRPKIQEDDGAPSDGKKEIVGMADGSVSSNSNMVVGIGKSRTYGFSNDSEGTSPKRRNGQTTTSDAKIVAREVERGSMSGTELSSDGKKEVVTTDDSVPLHSTEGMEIAKNLASGFKNDYQKPNSTIHNKEPTLDVAVPSPPSELKIKNAKADSRNCDLYQGKWINDPAGPLYTNNTCPSTTLTQMQNCQGNGRPDKDYENYRWKPDKCDLPRFNPKKFLELMRGKTLAFIGDSVARNQYESLLCILNQEETPRNRGNRRMLRWYFGSTSTMLIRIWSSWLVHQSDEPFQFAPQGVTKLFLDIPDKTIMELLPTCDVVVLSSGHWFAKQSAYVLDNNIVGGQLWWPENAGEMKVNNMEAFRISVETVTSAVANHPNFKGLAIVRSYSPDHYEGGAWNTGGSCTGQKMPVSEVMRNGYTDAMHEKQITGFNRALEKSGNGRSKLRLMDITEIFGYRSDGHPGPYRSPDPNKITKRGPNGEPPPQDCLHWCMPGPVDTWNEILLEVIRREFEGAGDQL